MRCAVEAAKINRRLLPVKSTYFFFLAGFGSLVPYIAVYMKMIGWSPSETALTCGIVCIITAFSRTFIGGVADKLNAHKTVLVVMCLLSAVFHGSMLFVPQRTSQETSHRATDVQLHCGTHAARVFACSGRPADDQNKEIMVSISSKSEGEPYAGDGTTACRWTCRIRQQQNNTQQTEQVCFVRSFNKKCITLFDATTFAFGVTKFQRRPAEDCQAMESSVSDVLSCHCYTVLSFVVGHDTFEQMVCQNQTTLTCSTDYCDPFGGYIVHNASRWSPSVERTGFDVGWTFWCVAILYLLGQMTIQPVFGLADAMAFTTLGKDRNKWGRQRLWGTLGFALFGLTSGLLMDVFDHIKNEYTVAFLLFAVFMILASVSACQYNMRGLDVTSPSQVCRDVLGLMRRPDAFVLFCVVLIFGMYQGLIGTFLFWYLKLLGDVPQLLLGLCLVHSAGPETVMLFYSGMIIQKIGHVFCISIVFVAFAVRMTSYSFLRNPWIVLCIEPLHSITFGLMYATASTYASRITPPGTHGSVQSILGALFLGFGRSFGVLLGGPLIETYGGAITFRMFGVSSLVFLILYLIAQKFWIQSVETLEVIEMKVPKEQQAKETDDYEEEHRMLDIQDGDKVRNDDIVKHECSVSDEQVT